MSTATENTGSLKGKALLRLSRAQWQILANTLSGTDNDDFSKEVLDMLNQSSDEEFTVALSPSESKYISALVQ